MSKSSGKWLVLSPPWTSVRLLRTSYVSYDYGGDYSSGYSRSRLAIEAAAFTPTAYK